MKQSIKAAVRDAKLADTRARKPISAALAKTQVAAATDKLLAGVTNDSFVNFAHKLGIGADNALTSGTYGYNPITRNRILLEWMYRGSWLAGVAIDVVADDMTRNGVDFVNEMGPAEAEAIEHEAINLNIWGQTNETIRWSRLYGGSIAVMLVDGQDPATPLRLETVGKDQFKGLLVLDRWMIEPSLEDLVTDYGPHLGLPKYYKVQSNAPALRGKTIHHSRLAYRLEGVQLPYQQRLTENLWGISVLERLYDRMIAFDSASTGAAQLVFKAFLRTLSIEGMREIAAAGGAPLNGLMQYTELMRRYQGIEGITLIDAKDDFEVQGSGTAISGVDGVLTQLAQQICGALQMPMTKVFGMSPGGLNSTGDSDDHNYDDNIKQQQNRHCLVGITTIYKLIAQSKEINLPDNFALAFTSLTELTDVQKSDVAAKTAETVNKAVDGGLIGRRTALLELRQSSRITGIFTNITQEVIDAADDEVGPPLFDPTDPFGVKDLGDDPSKPDDSGMKLPGDENEVRPNGKAERMGGGTPRRKLL